MIRRFILLFVPAVIVAAGIFAGLVFLPDIVRDRQTRWSKQSALPAGKTQTRNSGMAKAINGQAKTAAQIQPATPAVTPTNDSSPPRPPSDPPGPDIKKTYTWSEAETAMDRIRAARVTQPDAWDRLAGWYNFISDPEFTKSSSIEEHGKKLKALRADHSQSATLLVALGKTYLKGAWNTRGLRVDKLIGSESQAKFDATVHDARAALEQARDIGFLDGEGFSQLLEVARIEGWPLDQTRAVFDDGQKRDPLYFDLYTAMAEYLLPQWHGKAGDVERFAGEMANLLGGEDGLDAYLHIAYAVNQFDSNLLFWGDWNRKLLSAGAPVVAKRYPSAQNLVPFAALTTVVAQDQKAAAQIRPAVKSNEAFRVWLWRSVSAHFFGWCERASVEGGPADSLWGTPNNYGPIVFAGNDRAWCVSGYLPMTVTQWNLDSKTVEQALSSPASRVSSIAVDVNKNWVAGILGGERVQGWILWDIEQPNEPYIYRTTVACDAIAIHPTERTICWSTGSTVRAIDITNKEEKAPIERPTNVTELKYSSDGKLLAVVAGNVSVWDFAAGKRLYSLPDLDEYPQPPMACERMLDLDNEGRVWAIGVTSRDTAPRRTIVQFATDGSSFDEKTPKLNANGDLQAMASVLSPDRRYLAVLASGNKPDQKTTIQIWSLATGQCIGSRTNCHVGPIGSMAFSPDSSRLATSGFDGGPIYFWNFGGTQ